jgi:biopolymer transport protein ExbD
MLRRREKMGEGQGVDLGIIITPMLDMAFQLLAFFIMTYHPPAREAGLDGSLLPAAVAQVAGKKDTASSADPAVRTKLRVIVKAVPRLKEAGEPLQAGQPKTILLELPPLRIKEIAALKESGAHSGEAPADWGPALKALAEELAKSLQDPQSKDLELSIDADRALHYGYVIAVREVAEASGYKKIGFNAPR